MTKTYKNIVVCFMSIIIPGAQNNPYGFKEAPAKDDSHQSLQTNETCLHYLQDKNITIDKVFAFVTNEAKAKALPHLKETFKEVEFKEIEADQDDTANDCMKRMADMMKELQDYKKDNPDIKVHIDFTGGPRHASMLMLALFQMLKHDGYELGHIIYTKYISEKQSKTGYGYFVVEDATELLNIYTLISGAEEFSRFGSATQINEYFEENKAPCSGTMQDVLDAMDNFSEKLKICSSQSNMLDSIKSLSEALERYDAADATDNRESFFAKMLPGIKEKYAIILSERKTNKDGKIDYEHKNIFSLIYWCADKGFLQQALTYYTEWIPEYLSEKKWLEPNNGFDKKATQFDGNKNNSWYNYLFTTYNQWNPKLKIKLPDHITLYNILNSGNKPKTKPDDRRSYVSLSQLTGSIVACDDNAEIIRRFRIYEEQIRTLEQEFNKETIKNKDSFADVILAYYDNHLAYRNDESILMDVIDKLYTYGCYKNTNQANRANLKNLLKPFYTRQEKTFSFDIFAADLLRTVMNNIVDRSFDKKTQIHILSRLFLLHDNIDSATLQRTDFKSEQSAISKGIPRGEMFASLLANGDILVKKSLTEAKLIKLAEDYSKFKNEYRNRANHADFDGSKKSNIRLRKEIMDSVRPLCDFSVI